MNKKIKILIVRSRYHNTVKMYKKTLSIFKKRKLKHKMISVNGAFEIPAAISRNIKKYDGFVAIGILIKGQTPNFRFISQAIMHGLIQLSISSKKPVGNAILTCLNINQVKKRVNKGKEALDAIIDVLENKSDLKIIKSKKK